jgi:hypothetical protein
VQTTNDDNDLSFLFAGNAIEGIISGALTFLLLKGNILALISCKLWSALHTNMKIPVQKISFL